MVSVRRIVTVACAAVASADTGIFVYEESALAYAACQNVLSNIVLYFENTTVGMNTYFADGGFCNMNQQQAFGAMAHCLTRLPTQSGIMAYVDSCDNMTMQDFDNAYENATQYLVTNLTSYPGFNLSEIFYLPVEVDAVMLDGAYRSTLARYYNYNRANFFGAALLSYWFLLIAFAGFLRLLRALAPQTVNSFNGRVSNAYRRYITLSPLGRVKKVARGKLFTSFEYVIPTRIESIYILVWFVLVLAFNVADFHHETPNVFWTCRAADMGRQIADRSGIIALYMVPQFILFAGRNNFLQWVSGWSYSRFNVIHRWMARIALMLMITHGVSMSVNGILEDLYYANNIQAFAQWGYVAIIMAGFMCFHSLAYFRKNRYEVFVLSHNVMGAVFVAGVWIHVSPDMFQQIMYAAAAVWIFDKVARIVRMGWFGVQTANVQLIAGETLKVTVPRPASWKPHPFSYAYIYFFRKSCFWQSHPFTVIDSVVEQHVISFHIKVKGGMSNSLYQYLSQQPNRRASIKCAVEGPYGNGASLQHYDTVSYLAGGNGVPGPYSSALHLARKSTGQTLKLYWVIRHWKSIEWFYEELKALEGTNIQPVVYITQFTSPLDESFIDKSKEGSVDTKSEEKHSEDETEKDVGNDNIPRLMEKLHFIEFRTGRPDLEALIKQDINESNGAIAFAACGHDEFVDRSRRLVIDNLEEGKRVDFYDLMEMW